MKTVNYISHLLEENAEDVKALVLYFDQINIIEQAQLYFSGPILDGVTAEVVSQHAFTEENFLYHLKELERNNVIKYQYDVDRGELSLENGLSLISSDIQINNLVQFHPELIGKKHNEKKTTDKDGRIILKYELELNNEAAFLTEKLFKDAKNVNELLYYYARVFKTFVNYYEQGKDVLTSSKYINDLFKEISKTDRFKEAQAAFKNEFSVTPAFALEAIKLGIPNLGKFPPEEILRFKENSKSELLEFQTKLETLQFDLLSQNDFTYINSNAQKIADLKIRPLIENISNSLGNSKFKVVQELIKEAKDPKSYSPLLLSFSDKISSSMILLISVGLVGLNVGLEHYSRIKEAKKDGVYYLYKMQKYFE